MQKGFSPIFIVVILGVLVITAVGFVVYLQYSAPKEQLEQTACTQEAKVCPDGSAVGRTGPNCQFAECPEVQDETANWQKYTNTEYGFEFKYPEPGLISGGKVGSHLYLSLDNISVEINNSSVKFRTVNIRVTPINYSGYCDVDNNTKAESYKFNDIIFMERKYGEGGNVSKGYYYEYFTSKNNDCFILSFALQGSSTEEFLEPVIFRQILSTFKFIEQ
ncbi:MAG: hypothetical protein ABIJ84_04690 [bacterium]